MKKLSQLQKIIKSNHVINIEIFFQSIDIFQMYTNFYRSV
jgi:hypothetical protein